MSTAASRIVERFLRSADSGEQNPPEVDTIMGGIAILIAQSVIVQNAFYDEKEIKRFLLLRRQYHEQFTAACAKLAEDIEAGEHGSGLVSTALGLRAVSKLSVKQDRQALVQVLRILRGLRRISREEASPVVLRLIRETYGIAEGDSEGENSYYGTDYTSFFKDVTRLSVIPTQMRTLLRKVIQLGKGSNRSLTLKPHEDENPGAWFDLPTEEQDKIRKLVEDTEANYSKKLEDKTPEEQQEIWKNSGQTLKKIQRQVGVNLNIVKNKGEAKESIEEILKRESKMVIDGGTLFVMTSVIKSFEESAKYTRYQQESTGQKGFDAEKVTVPREAGKFVTLLQKARTIDTARRIIQEAADRKIVSGHLMEDLKSSLSRLETNKAIRDGVKLVPLHFEPTTVEAFQAEHNTGEVEFPKEMDEKEQKDLLGHVARSISDLEGIFGKGFCGKHGKKLAFRFGGGTGFMAAAHYFAWDDREPYSGQKIWQPRVTFGDDYKGLLAHELSHYFEDLIAYRLDKKEMEAKGEKGEPSYGGSGDIFGRSSAKYFATMYQSEGGSKRLQAMLPEAGELMIAITNTPDYARWEDRLNASYEIALPGAVKNLTGKDMYDLPEDHPYHSRKIHDARYKSDLPPELIAEAEKGYSKLKDGDTRKLSYHQSAAEVWARMTEQYVYTKLSRAGIVNPWLTQLTYDQDVFMDEKRFEKEIEPIYDRLFASMGAKNILAKLVRRWKATALRAS